MALLGINNVGRLVASGLNPAVYAYNAIRTHDITPGFNAPSIGKLIGGGGGNAQAPPKKSGSSSGSGTYTGGSGSSSASSSAASQQAAQQAAQIAAYNQSIANEQAGINRLSPSFEVSKANAQAAYNQAINQLNQQKALDQQSYNKNVGQTKTDYVGAKNTIGTQAGNSLNSLLRLLGAHGAGGGSAALYNAPEAVTRQATIQRTGASDTYGKNMQNLDTNWNNYLNAYNQNLKAEDIKRQNSVNSAWANIDQQRAAALQNLAKLIGARASAQGGDASGASQPYLDQANAFLNEAVQKGRAVPVPKANPLVYNAPDLAAYTVNPNATPTVQGQSPASDYFSPYLSALLGKKQDNTAAIPVGA